jgi:hypothetical protein
MSFQFWFNFTAKIEDGTLKILTFDETLGGAEKCANGPITKPFEVYLGNGLYKHPTKGYNVIFIFF